jgi:sortase A
MKVTVGKTPLRAVLRWARWILLSTGLGLLGYCAYVAVDAWWFQGRESRMLERILKARKAADVDLQYVKAPGPPPRPGVSMMHGLIGRIDIARLGVSVMVMEGFDGKTLRRGAGHIPGTALPGQQGNVGISAHRDTFFRPLRNIQAGDVMTVTTLDGEYEYRVVSTKVVSPSDVSVLNPTGGEVLTLVTCYPFYYAGAAPERFIVRAVRF